MFVPRLLIKPGNLESHLPWCVGDHSKAVVIPLRAGLILCARTELVIPGALQIIVIVVNRTARRKGGQRLHVGRFLQVMSIPVRERKLVARVEAVIQSARRQVLVRVVRKDSSVGLELIHKKGVHRVGGRVHVRAPVRICAHAAAGRFVVGLGAGKPSCAATAAPTGPLRQGTTFPPVSPAITVF